MSKLDNVPMPAVHRLSLYLRELELFNNAGLLTISSQELGESLGLSAAQVRKDLAYFGQFGHAGIGYRVPELIHRLRRIMGTDRLAHVLILGVGNLGRALISFRGFSRHGFEVVAAFDNDPAKVGERVPAPEGLIVQHVSAMPQEVKQRNIRIGVLAVPSAAAQSAAELMVESGVRAILNFAPVTLQVSAEVAVSSVDLGVHLEQLSFRMHGANGA